MTNSDTIPKKGLSEALVSLEGMRERYPRQTDLFGTRDSGKTILSLGLADALQRRSELRAPTLRTPALSDQATRLRGKQPLETTAFDDTAPELDGLEGFVLSPGSPQPTLIVSLPHVDPARANVPAWLRYYKDPGRHVIAVAWAPRLHLELCWSVFCFYLEQFSAADPKGNLPENAKLAFMVAINADHRDALASTNTDGLKKLLADSRLAEARVTVKWHQGEARLAIDGGGLTKDEGRRVVSCLREAIEDAVSVARDAEAPVRELLQGLRSQDQVLVLTGRDIIQPTPAWSRQEWLEEINTFYFGPQFVRSNRNVHLLGNVIGKVRADAGQTGELPVYVRDTNAGGLTELMPVIEEWSTVHVPLGLSATERITVAREVPSPFVAEEQASGLPSFLREAVGSAIIVLPLAVLAWSVLPRTWDGLGWAVVGALVAGGAISWARIRLLPPSWVLLRDGRLRLPSVRRSADLAPGAYSVRRSLLDRVRDTAKVLPAGQSPGWTIYGYSGLRPHGPTPESSFGLDLVPALAASVAAFVLMLV
ncbi:MAG: hypothetical protein IPN34_17645 [Planctomycetes bacterium]|nr:hypothetical protein [Planctomycetota bacterium]